MSRARLAQMEVSVEPSVGLLARRKRGRKKKKTATKRVPRTGVAGMVVQGTHDDRLRDYVRTHRSRVTSRRAHISDELNCYCTSRRRVGLDEWVEELCGRNLASAALNILMARTGSSTDCSNASAGLRFRLEEGMFGDGDFFNGGGISEADADVDGDCFDTPCLFGTRVTNRAFTLRNAMRDE